MNTAYIDIHVRRNSDGELRIRRWNDVSQMTLDGLRFNFSEGNWGCDCNRHLEFERAIRPKHPCDEGIDCGEGAYTIERITDDNGTVLYEDK